MEHRGYPELQQALATQNWQEADRLTTLYTFPLDSTQFPLDDPIAWQQGVNKCMRRFSVGSLKAIDDLWLDYSQGRFGFRVQQQIYDDINALWLKYPRSLHYAYRQFQGRLVPSNLLALTLGWVTPTGNELEFDGVIQYSLKAPLGHLPTVGRQSMGVALHQGYLLHWIFQKLPKNWV